MIDIDGQETTLDGGFSSYGASSEAEKMIMLGSGARERESARWRRSIDNQVALAEARAKAQAEYRRALKESKSK